MTVDEAARDGLRRRLDEALGPEHATTLIRAAQAEILATIRGDMVTQTRAMFVTMAASVSALGGLALGLACLV